MAELDRRLRQGERIITGLERLVGLMPGPFGRRRREKPEKGEDKAAAKQKQKKRTGPRQPGVFGRGE
jgi:hypothetical protein